MRKYFLVFLKVGSDREQDEEVATIQEEHFNHLSKLYDMEKISITGPIDGESDIRGIVIYNTATKEEAREMAEQDPAVRAGRLVVEVHPWWAAKGSTLK